CISYNIIVPFSFNHISLLSPVVGLLPFSLWTDIRIPHLLSTRWNGYTAVTRSSEPRVLFLRFCRVFYCFDQFHCFVFCVYIFVNSCYH
ncbi:hypothetical protein L9F63_010734, partial [Diploptera punctata]